MAPSSPGTRVEARCDHVPQSSAMNRLLRQVRKKLSNISVCPEIVTIVASDRWAVCVVSEIEKLARKYD